MTKHGLAGSETRAVGESAVMTDTLREPRHWRVAILGLGHWYSAYGVARALRDFPAATLVGCAWHRRAQLDAFTNAFGIEGYADYDALLDRPDIDIVQIAAPVSEIPGLAIRAARAGKHLVLGKPMAMTLDEADRMVQAVDESGVTCVPFQAISRLRQTWLKARLDRGEIGELRLLHQTARWAIAEDWPGSGQPGWFAERRHVPGGALIDEGIYAMDLFRWLTASEVVGVEARTANLVHTGLEVEDWGMATFTFASGVRATLEGSWTITAPRATGPSPKQNSVVRLEAIGTRGEIHDQFFRDPGRAILAAGAADWVFERAAGDLMGSASPAPLDHLIDCLETGRTPIATIHDARASFAMAMAAYQAARS
jgi:scyllo-inositol 2-dehydrogenase (NAD+)